VRALRYAVGLVGADSVGLGSDFDGATHTPLDTEGLARITEGLQKSGMAEIEIRKVMGENVLRVLRQELPGG
ncbi:MAG TPA: membrane dipeptidase, partial [Terriglobales bacterium]|nr:membrane dipeptidase [Terriglobales bacterium]